MIAELRAEVTDANGEPVVTSIVTMLGEAASDTEADEQVAAIKARIGGF